MSIETLAITSDQPVEISQDQPRRRGIRKTKSKKVLVVDGDELWPFEALAKYGDITTRTVRKMNFAKGRIGGVGYGSFAGFKRALAGQMVAPGKRSRRRW
jgi:hypothetical protein